MYGSSFWIDTETPRLLSKRPSEAAVIPLPSELTTPPVKKMYFAILIYGEAALRSTRNRDLRGVDRGIARLRVTGDTNFRRIREFQWFPKELGLTLHAKQLRTGRPLSAPVGE